MGSTESEGGYDASIRSTNFAERLRNGDTFGLLLALIIVGYLLMGLLDNTKWARTIMAVVMGAILVLALHTSHINRRYVRAAFGLAVAATAIALAQASFDSDLGVAALGYLMFFVTAAAPVVVLVRIARHPDVNVETILGAFSAYLLIGLVFAGIYRGFSAWGSEPFFTQTDAPSPVEYVYFSFTTLTTTGYGDFTPSQDGGRVVANLEQLTGQVFLVTIVSSLVANFGRSRRPRGS